MTICFETFLEWAEDKFGDIKVKGNEIRACSIFHPTDSDTKYRLWMSPSGGKHGREHGVYHCFDTDRKGTLLGLIMMIEKCPFEDALEIAGGTTLTADLEGQIDAFFANKEDTVEEIENSICLPDDCYYIDEVKDNNRTAIEAAMYLETRKIPTEGLMVCLYGEYRDRIVIPYYDRDRELIYFNSRTLIDKDWIPKYKGPPKEIGVGKEDVIYMQHWPELGSKIYVTEGEFDSIVLRICGFNAAACGSKNLSETQINYLRDYDVIIALDQDKAGQKALITWYEQFKDNGINEFSYVSPPKGFKDWNQLYEKTDIAIVRAFVNKERKNFSEEQYVDMTFNFLKS
jgi:DNA primase